MEEPLQKLVEHAEPKASYNIVTGNTSRLQTVFNPPLVFAGGSSCHYEMALIKLETYYSFPNIKATNNCMKISIDKGASWNTNWMLRNQCNQLTVTTFNC